MALYLVRAGRDGQFENRFISDNRIHLRWGGLFINKNIASLGDYESIKLAALSEAPDEKTKIIINGVSQINAFVHRMAQGDFVVVPLKHKPAVRVVKASLDCSVSSRCYKTHLFFCTPFYTPFLLCLINIPSN